MPSAKRRYSKDEFARRGDALVESKVRPHLTTADEHKFVAIDIETGEYELDKDEMKAVNRLRKRIADPQSGWCMLPWVSPSLRRAWLSRPAMIVGIVQRREALIRLTVRGFRGRQQEIEAVVDSGYTGWLTLPPSAIARLNLRSPHVNCVRSSGCRWRPFGGSSTRKGGCRWRS
jgi:hypothetical protein